MKQSTLSIIAILATLLAFAGGFVLGVQFARPSVPLSPPGSAQTTLGTGPDAAQLTVKYARPYARNRVIFGELLPYGKVWRTGADESTTFETTKDLRLGETLLPAGAYSLYSIPRENGFTLIINEQTGQWGTQYDEARDFARIEMDVSKIEHKEQFTIRFAPANRDGLIGTTALITTPEVDAESATPAAWLILEWETTRASLLLELA